MLPKYLNRLVKEKACIQVRAGHKLLHYLPGAEIPKDPHLARLQAWKAKHLTLSRNRAQATASKDLGWTLRETRQRFRRLDQRATVQGKLHLDNPPPMGQRRVTKVARIIQILAEHREFAELIHSIVAEMPA